MVKFLQIVAILVPMAGSFKLSSLAQSHTSTLERLSDGPTNGVMADEDRDDDVQVLCDGMIPTSSDEYSSTCNDPRKNPKGIMGK